MRSFAYAILCPLLMMSLASLAGTSPIEKPKLIVVIVIDQFRSDFLTRFESQFQKDGFRALMKDGAYFPFGEYDVLQAMTGPGHATILTGAYPYQTGIPINDWYDQTIQDSMYCVEDRSQETVGAPMREHVGTSPKNLIGTTLGDEMKNAGMSSKVVTVALKDRAAILMGGHRADLAVWFDGASTRWVSSKYYLKDGKLPGWMETLNEEASKNKCDLASPCGTQVTLKAFHGALKNFKLGQGSATDLIAVSFSSHDYVGHMHGPNSREIGVMTLSEDAAVAEIRGAVAKAVPGGLKNVLFVLTADHGVAPSTKYLLETGIETGRIDEGKIAEEIERVLAKKYGAPKNGKWLRDVVDFNFFLDERSIRSGGLDLEKIEMDVKDILLKNPAFAQAVTRGEWEARKLPPGMFGRKVDRTFFRGRSGNVIGIQKPFFINESKNAANHMSGYSYDRTVPILFAGPGIRGGVYADPAEVVDIAPTLSFLLGIVPPAVSEGKVLKQALSIAK